MFEEDDALVNQHTQSQRNMRGSNLRPWRNPAMRLTGSCNGWSPVVAAILDQVDPRRSACPP